MNKNLLQLACLSVVLLSLIWSCQKENLVEDISGVHAPPLQGTIIVDPDSACDGPYSLPLAIASGNQNVDFCGNSPCTVSIPWGELLYWKGLYVGDPHLFIELRVAPTWVITGYSYVVSPPGPIQTSGQLPVVGTGWRSESPTVWGPGISLLIPLEGSLNAASCFEWAVVVDAVKVNLFGAAFPNSNRSLYAYDVNGSGSPFVIDRCYAACPEQDPSTTLTQGTCSGCQSEVSVTYIDCNAVDLASCKPINKVEINYSDCSKQRFDHLNATSLHYNATPGKSISHVKVKSGCKPSHNGNGGSGSNGSGGAHGSMEYRFDLPCFNANCVHH